MGLLDLASGNSFWRGHDYYEAEKVKSCKKSEEEKYEGVVEGTKAYEVCIDLLHPKKSTCTCPHAEGTRRVCKHKVALYFAVFPEEAEQALKDAEEWEQEEELRWEEECEEIRKYVNSLSKQELRDELVWRIIEERNYRRW